MDPYRAHGPFVPADIARATARSGWAPDIDVRVVGDPSSGLFMVGDGYGPTYGGHYFPLALDPVLEAVQRRIRAGGDLVSAMIAARETAGRLSDAYEGVVKSKLHARGRDAARLVRPDLPPEAGDLFHGGVGVTAACLEGRGLAVAQIGMSRIYLARRGERRLLARDHSLASEFAREAGEEHPGYREILADHRTVVTRMLGIGAKAEVDHVVEPLEAGDRVVLCSQGIWNHAGGDRFVEHLFDVAAARFAEIVSDATRASRLDAGAIRFDVARAFADASRA